MIGDIREVQKLNKWTTNEVGGFEVLIDDFDEVDKINEEIYSEIPSTLTSKSIVNAYPNVFEWIELFDNNVWFIIAIMILIAGINMITALLVLILERVQMIGIFIQRLLPHFKRTFLGKCDWVINPFYTALF